MEEKYYLLTFNEDYADEHDVPGLACFTKEEYNEWSNTPSGKLNEDYDEQMKIYQSKIDDYNNFQKEISSKSFYNKLINQYTKEEREWYDNNKKDYVSSYRDKPNRCESQLRAYLGNGGDCFEESYTHLYLMKEYVETGIVDVLEVDKSFYDYFHLANLANLSLTNVFTNIGEY